MTPSRPASAIPANSEMDGDGQAAWKRLVLVAVQDGVPHQLRAPARHGSARAEPRNRSAGTPPVVEGAPAGLVPRPGGGRPAHSGNGVPTPGRPEDPPSFEAPAQAGFARTSEEVLAAFSGHVRSWRASQPRQHPRKPHPPRPSPPGHPWSTGASSTLLTTGGRPVRRCPATGRPSPCRRERVSRDRAK